MDSTQIVQAYFAALDSTDMSQASQYLSEDYQLLDFARQPMNKAAMLDLLNQLKAALPNLKHSLSNLQAENNVVKLTVQLSGTHYNHLDLRSMGIGVVPRSQRFIIFPNEIYEFTVSHGKIVAERNISPASPNRRMSGMLKALGVNVAIL
jgi:hypothetical protein